MKMVVLEECGILSAWKIGKNIFLASNRGIDKKEQKEYYDTLAIADKEGESTVICRVYAQNYKR